MSNSDQSSWSTDRHFYPEERSVGQLDRRISPPRIDLNPARSATGSRSATRERDEPNSHGIRDQTFGSEMSLLVIG